MPKPVVSAKSLEPFQTADVNSPPEGPCPNYPQLKRLGQCSMSRVQAKEKSIHTAPQLPRPANRLTLKPDNQTRSNPRKYIEIPAQVELDKRARDSCPKQEAHQYPDLRLLTKLYSAILCYIYCSFCCSLLLPVPSVACPTPTLPELDLNGILLRLTGSAKTCDRQIRVGRGLGRSYGKLNLLTAAHAKVYHGIPRSGESVAVLLLRNFYRRLKNGNEICSMAFG